MKIHGGQSAKTVQSAAPPCRDEPPPPPPAAAAPRGRLEREETSANSSGRLARPQSGEPREECGERRREDVRRRAGRGGPGAEGGTSREAAPAGVVPDGAGGLGRRGGQRERRYRKRVSVRWGSLQCSLALVLVVRSASGPCRSRSGSRGRGSSGAPRSPLTAA